MPAGGGRYAAQQAAGGGGGFNPADYGTVAFWYDPTQGVTDAGGGAVSAWADQSGNGRTLSQGTGASRPTTGTRTQNGLNVIDFDGTADRMTTSSFTQAEPWSVFLVWLSDTNAATRLAMTHLGTDGSSNYSGFGVTTDSGGSWYYSGFSGDTIGAGTADTNAHIMSYIIDSATLTLYEDGTQIATSGNTNGITGGICVGAFKDSSNFWNGWLGDIIGYSGALNDTNRDNLEAALGTRWGITVA